MAAKGAAKHLGLYRSAVGEMKDARVASGATDDVLTVKATT